jgi:hypothetical protein
VQAVRAGVEAADEEVLLGEGRDAVGDRAGSRRVGVGVVGSFVADELQGGLDVGG